MAKHGILVDYEWCTGCHSCEFACQMEHGFPVGQTGVMVKEVGPYRIEGDHWQYAYMPVPTDQCDPVSYTHLDVYKRQGLASESTSGTLRAASASKETSEASAPSFERYSVPVLRR